MPRSLEKKELDGYDSSQTQATFSLLQVAWKRKALIVLGAVVGLAAAWVYYLQRPAVYESTAQIKVERTFPAGPVQAIDSPMSFYEDYIATQMEIVRSQVLIRSAVKGNPDPKHSLPPLTDLASFEGQNESGIVSTIHGSLGVSRVTQSSTSTPTNLLNLTYRGSNSEDCKTILQQLILSYENYCQQQHQQSAAKQFDELDEMRGKVQLQIDEGNKRLHAMTDINKTIRNKDGESIDVETLLNHQTQQENMVRRVAETKLRLEDIKRAVAEDRDATPWLDLTADSTRTAAGPEGGTLEDQLRPLQIDERKLLNKYGQQHPEVVENRAQQKAIREYWEEQHPNAGSAKVNPNDKKASPEVVDIYVRSLEKQLIDLQIAERVMSARVKKETEDLLKKGGNNQAEIDLRKDLNEKRELVATYRRRMEEVNLVKDHGGIVSETMADPVPGYQVEPRMMPILLPGLLGGLLVGVALAWLAEVSDQSFRNPEDIRRRLKVQVLGHVPRISPTAEEKQMAEEGLLPLDPSVCAFYQPKSVDAESFRGLRTTLFFKLEGAGHRIIQVTSPNMGDGKTTLATNLAVSIAQSGKRILLVDADFRRPRLHKMFGVDATTGLASVIAEDADLQDAIQATPVPNLSLLPCGPRPNNPAELLTSKRFLDLLEVLREQFDVVLIDTPPLLAVSDPSVVAPRVDGVLLTIRVAKNGRPAAERAREILANLGANVYGVVVNGIDGGANQGYGASQYGYSYNYAYGYTYDAADNSSYYHDADADAAVNGAAHHGNGTNGKARSGRSRQQRKKSAGLIRWLREALWH